MNTKFITKSLILTTALAMMLLLSMPSRAGLAEAYSAYSNNDYKTALKEYLPFAKKGNDEAQLKVGMIYFNGLDTVQNYRKGFEWLTKSAELENPLALGYLGAVFAEGQAVKRNLIFAHAYLNLAEANRYKYPEHEEQLKMFASLRDEIGEKLTPTELEAAQAFATYSQKFATNWKKGLHLPKYDEVK